MFFDWRWWLIKKIWYCWDKVRSDIKKEFYIKPVYNKEFLKTKKKSHGDEVADFYDKEIRKVDSNHTCLAVTSLDSALTNNENNHPQVFLKQCKYIEKKLIRYIHNNLSNFSNSSGESDKE